ncbi:MAG: ABC transporter substrate-binding protein [Gemmatimonadales bacterium]
MPVPSILRYGKHMLADGGDRMTVRSRRSAVILCGSLVLAAVACARDRDALVEDPDTYTALVWWADWGPRMSRDGVGKFLVFLELATPAEDGVLEGRLAKSWEHSSDYREWTIHLRTDVRWHDGVPVTAHDIEFTVDLWNHPEVLYPLNPIESVEVLDDSTFILTYKPGNAWHTYWYPGYWTVFYPAHLLENLDPAEFEEWDFWKRPVGNGPFRYVRHLPRTMVEFEANPDFYLGRPQIDRMVVKFGPESITELLAGNVDAMNLENRSALDAIEDDPRFRVYYEAWDDISAVLALYYDHRDPRFSDAKVRRAITHAIDRRELRRLLHQWPELPIVDVPFTESQYWKRELPDPLVYDPALSKRLLSDAGWRDPDGDGLRERDGEAFTFRVIVQNRYLPAAVYVQRALAGVGLRAEIVPLEFATLRERISAGDFQVAIGSLWVSPDDPDAGLRVVFGENSVIGWHDERVLELVNGALEASTPAALDSIYRELAPIVQDQQPVTFLSFGTEMYIAHQRVQGLSSPFRANPIWSAGHLWIEEQP